MDQWPTTSEPYLMGKPKSQWFGCRLCSQFGYAVCLSASEMFTLILSHFRGSSGVKEWRVFKNNSGSSPTTPFRRHLEDHHPVVWVQECARLNIPLEFRPQGSQEPKSDAPEIEPFSRDGLLRHLVEFVSSDDQVRSLHFTLEGSSLTTPTVDKYD
jgi:hypothetical protein